MIPVCNASLQAADCAVISGLVAVALFLAGAAATLVALGLVVLLRERRGYNGPGD